MPNFFLILTAANCFDMLSLYKNMGIIVKITPHLSILVYEPGASATSHSATMFIWRAERHMSAKFTLK